MDQGIGWQNRVDQRLAEFIKQHDSFYLGITNSEGQPYI